MARVMIVDHHHRNRSRVVVMVTDGDDDVDPSRTLPEAVATKLAKIDVVVAGSYNTTTLFDI